MQDEELIVRFDRVWENMLHQAVLSAERCDPEDARRKVKPDQQRWVHDDEEQREFWLEGGLFIAQIAHETSGQYLLDQLWFVRSSNVDPRTLFVTFETLEVRRLFDQVASKSGWKAEDLGEKILLDFIETITRKPIPRRVERDH